VCVKRKKLVYDEHVVPALLCPHCAEPLETYPDPGGGEEQDYVEDCAVCCRPIRFVAVYDPEDREYRVEVSGET
jgi:hypothetical protein